jgi:hypothetical protein
LLWQLLVPLVFNIHFDSPLCGSFDDHILSTAK